MIAIQRNKTEKDFQQKNTVEEKVGKKSSTTLPFLKLKYLPNEFFEMKKLALEFGATHLRACYVDKITKEAIYHKKTKGSSEWFKDRIQKYSFRQIRHYLRKYSSSSLDEKARSSIFNRERNRNREKTLRKMKFDPEFRAFYVPECFKTIEQLFGKKAFYALKKHVIEPATIKPLWAAQFLNAYEKLKLNVPSDQVFEKVKSSKEFQETAIKEKFLNTLNRLLSEETQK